MWRCDIWKCNKLFLSIVVLISSENGKRDWDRERLLVSQKVKGPVNDIKGARIDVQLTARRDTRHHQRVSVLFPSIPF